MTVTSAAIDPRVGGGASATAARRLQRLASALAVAAILLTLVALLLTARGDRRFMIGLDLSSFGFLLSATLSPIVGALIVQRRPFTRVAWLLITLGIGIGLGLTLFGIAILAMPIERLASIRSFGDAPVPILALILSQVIFLPSLAGSSTLLLLLFPTDRLASSRWRWVAVLFVVGSVLYTIGLVFRVGDLDPGNLPGLPNPLGGPAALASALDATEGVGNALTTVAVVLAGLSIVVRYRRADRTEAAQIRWLAVIGAVATPASAIAAFQRGPVSDTAFAIAIASLALMPVAIGIAITRYHLYDIDRLINRAIVYGSLTAILAGIFTAGISLAQRLFIATTGQTADAAIVITTLIVATLYAPLRKRLEALVDVRFKYDHRRFGPYRDEITRVLEIVDPVAAARRLIEQAVRELEARGGAVLGEDDAPTATAGDWPVPAVVRLTIPGGSGALRKVVVGPRLDGRPHDPESIVDLEGVAGLASAAVHAARSPASEGAAPAR